MDNRLPSALFVMLKIYLSGLLAAFMMNHCAMDDAKPTETILGILMRKFGFARVKHNQGVICDGFCDRNKCGEIISEIISATSLRVTSALRCRV